MSAEPHTSYDAVPYPSYAFTQTHPSRVAAVARLFGVPAASPTRCRVLELGVGDGSNLIPLAAEYPDSEFVGVDLAPSPVARGNAIIDGVGLANVRLHAADLREVGDRFGAFDYVIAHGVFSWVPEDVRHALLELCDQVLTPAGVAYVSYNALPGCYLRKIFWDLLKLHTAKLTDPAPKVRQAKAILHFMAEGVIEKSYIGEYMRQEAKAVGQDRHEAVLYHDDLSSINQPYYFHEFAAMAARHGLEFLSEAELSDIDNDVFPDAIAAQLRQMGGNVHIQEQYRDFLRVRRFRQTLLVRHGAPIDRPPAADRVPELAAAFHTRPDVTDPDLAPGVQVKFQTASGAALTIDHPAAKAALAVLGRRWPHPLGFDELVAGADRLLGPGEGADRQVVAEVVLAAAGSGMVNLFLDPPRTVTAAGDRPRLSPFARYQIDAGLGVLTNRLHVPVKLEDALTRRLFWCLDGTRDRDAVVADLAAWAEKEAGAKPDGPRKSAAEWRAEFAAKIDQGFAKAAELAVLAE